MRVVILAVAVFSILTSTQALGGACGGPDARVKLVPRPVTQENYSSFRGIDLSSSPDYVRWRAQSLGFDTITWHRVGADIISAVSFCADRIEIGRADFDATGKIVRLALKQRFFSERPKFVRKFADELFEFYDVQTSKVDDDVCFQDVTCFKGVSKFGEQFLILRLGPNAELFVRP